MLFLYNIGIIFFRIGIQIASLFNSKAKEWISGRKNQKFPEIPSESKVIWFHCASLGEFDQGIPLMKKIKESEPNSTILVTFFSPSGMKHYHKRNHPADIVCYLPLDTPSKAKAFIKHFQPELSFFIKYEFWLNHIFEAKKNGSQIYNVSGLFRPNHRFFKWYGGNFRKALKKFDWFFVQNNKSKTLLNSIGIEKVTVVGDTRFDRVLENKKSVQKDAKLNEFCGEIRPFIVGSSWPEDEKILLTYINSSLSKTIIAPHNVDEVHVQSIVKNLQLPYARYSQSNTEELKNAQVLIIDTIGQLANAYSYGSFAYIGGGFSGSLHNILEPSVYGLPVIFGPKHDRFPEAQSFIDHGIGFSVNSEFDLKETSEFILMNLLELSKKTSTFVEKQSGSTEKIYSSVFN